jgi:hypothetical protein
VEDKPVRFYDDGRCGSRSRSEAREAPIPCSRRRPIGPIMHRRRAHENACLNTPGALRQSDTGKPMWDGNANSAAIPLVVL